MAIIKTGSSAVLPLDLASLPVGLPSTPADAGAPAGAGFHLLFQGSLQAQGARPLSSADGKPLPPGGEVLPEADETPEMLVTDGVAAPVVSTNAATSTETMAETESDPVIATESAAGSLPSEGKVAEQSVQTIGLPTLPDDTATQTAGQPRQGEPGVQAVAPASVQPAVTPAQSQGQSVAAGRPADQALPQAEGTAAASQQATNPAVLAERVSPPVQGEPLTAAQTTESRKGGAPQQTSVEGTAAAEVSGSPVATMDAEAGSLGNPGASKEAEAANTAPTPTQNFDSANVDRPADGRVPVEVSNRLPQVSEGGVDAVATGHNGAVAMSESPVGLVRQPSVASAGEVTDLVGKEAAAMPVAQRQEGQRLPAEPAPARQDAASQSLQLQAADEGGDLSDSGQQSRQENQNAAATAAAAGRGATAATGASVQPGQTFAQQLQQQMAEPRWGRQVSERAVMMAQHGPRTAHIQLDPPELGAMQIRVHLQGQDLVSVSFTSANPAVRDALEQQLPRLREMFADQGLNLQDSSVSDEARQQGSDRREQAETFGRSGDYGGPEGSEMEVLPAPAVAVGLVDYYA